MRLRFQLLLIAAIVLFVYYPSIFAELNQVDDIGMVNALTGMTGFSFRSVFVPGSGGGLYYRPLLILSYFFDKYLWAFDSSFMHLENILMHLGNALLVFFLSRELLAEKEKRESLIPLICSLLFALHPANVESVSWVSGRTDPLACLFVISGAICLLRLVKRGSSLYLLPAAVLLFLGCITKESAVGFLLGAVFLIMAKREGADETTRSSGKSPLREALLTVLVVSAAIALFFLLRSLAFSSNKSNIGLTLTYWKVNPYYSFTLVLRAFAFYLKKIFWPFPLNFAILQVDPVYELFALPLLGLTLMIAWRRTVLSALFLGGLGLIAPSFVIVFGQIAWTPFSERYVYMASAFVIISAVHCLCGIAKKLDQVPLHFIYGRPWPDASPREILITGRAVSRLALCLVLPVALLGAVQRVQVWRSNVSLFADTARKSNDSNEVRNMYGVALFRRGDMGGAEREMAVASSLYSFVYDEKFDLNYASVLRELGKYAEAGEVYRKVSLKTKGKSLTCCEDEILLLQSRLNVCMAKERTEIRRKLLETCDRFYGLHPDADKLFTLGQTALSLHEKQKALKYFTAALEQTARTNPYRAFTAKTVARLQGTGV